MSWEEFSDECPGCRPALIDVETGKVLPEDSPTMQIIFTVWRRTTRKERQVFHRVTCLNSRVPSDLRIFHAVTMRLQSALQASDTRH